MHDVQSRLHPARAGYLDGYRESAHQRASRVHASGSWVPVPSLQILLRHASCARIFGFAMLSVLGFTVSRSPALHHQGVPWAGAPGWLVPDFCKHKAAVRASVVRVQRPVSAQETESNQVGRSRFESARWTGLLPLVLGYIYVLKHHHVVVDS
jgi:hypothetical protein